MLRWAGKSGSMVWAQLEGEKNEKTICCFCSGMSDSGSDAALGSAQTDKASRPSPAAKASCALADGKTITVDYSSPRAKGRKIFGGLVPYGEVVARGRQ